MARVDKHTLKTLIVISNNAKEADQIIEEYTEFRTVKEKIAFITAFFWPIQIIERQFLDSDEIYRRLLNAVIAGFKAEN